MFKRKMRESSSAQERQSMFDAPFWRFFSGLGDFFLLTCFWLATSLPLVTIGASTTAVFYVTLKNRSAAGGTLWKMYWKSFKQNFKQATFIWLLYVFIVIDVCIAGWMLHTQGLLTRADLSWGGQYNVALIVGSLFYFAMMIYAAALLAFFQQTTKQCLISALCLCFSRLFSTLYFMLVVGVLAFATWFFFPPLAFVGLPLAVYLISLRMNVLFHQQIDRAEKRAADQKAAQG